MQAVPSMYSLAYSFTAFFLSQYHANNQLAVQVLRKYILARIPEGMLLDFLHSFPDLSKDSYLGMTQNVMKIENLLVTPRLTFWKG